MSMQQNANFGFYCKKEIVAPSSLQMMLLQFWVQQLLSKWGNSNYNCISNCNMWITRHEVNIKINREEECKGGDLSFQERQSMPHPKEICGPKTADQSFIKSLKAESLFFFFFFVLSHVGCYGCKMFSHLFS